MLSVILDSCVDEQCLFDLELEQNEWNTSTRFVTEFTDAWAFAPNLNRGSVFLLEILVDMDHVFTAVDWSHNFCFEILELVFLFVTVKVSWNYNVIARCVQNSIL